MIFHKSRLDACLAELFDDGLHLYLVAAGVIGQIDAAITLVVDKTK